MRPRCFFAIKCDQSSDLQLTKNPMLCASPESGWIEGVQSTIWTAVLSPFTQQHEERGGSLKVFEDTRGVCLTSTLFLLLVVLAQGSKLIGNFDVRSSFC